MTPVVEMIGVSREYGVLSRVRTIRALRNVTLSIAEGEILGVLGPNGSGKSTLLKTVVGFVRPTTGLVRVFGCAADSLSSRKKVGFLPDSPCFQRHFSARELLDFYAGLYGYTGNARRMRVSGVLEEAGLVEAADRRIGGYSKGMLQRLGFAQAILHDPRLLVLDEPGNGLDPEGVDYVATMLETSRLRGRTVLVASHLISQMENACDRIAIMVDGQIAHVANLRGLGIERAYGGDASSHEVGISREVAIAGNSQKDGPTLGRVESERSVGLLAVYRSVVGAARRECRSA